MNALVTGGAGFIGSNLVRLLLSRGMRVTVVDNLSTGYRENLQDMAVEFVPGDVRDAAVMDRLAAGADVLFHMAAHVGNVKSLSDPVTDSEINVIGTLNVLQAARKQGVKTVVYSSSAATFGELVTTPISEDHPQNPDSPYGVSKLAAEKHVLCFGRVYGFRAVCLRYFNVYGVNQRYDAYGNVIPIFTERLFAGEPLTIYGDGEQTRDFVNVHDVAVANYLAATTSRATGVYNIGSGASITINLLAELAQEVCGVRAVVQHATPRSGEVRHCQADIRKAQVELGFSPDSDMAAGLQEYFVWFRQDQQRTG